jgi:hypothetical protein
MIRELEFVESDWVALRWAAGSLTALFRHAVPRQVKVALERAAGPADRRPSNGKKVVGVMLGVGFAGALLALFVCGLWHHILILLPHGEWERATVAVIGVLEIAYLRVAIALWRPRRAVALGILFGGLALTVHVAMHTRPVFS